MVSGSDDFEGEREDAVGGLRQRGRQRGPRPERMAVSMDRGVRPRVQGSSGRSA